MAIDTRPSTSLSALSAAILPGDAGYDDARRASTSPSTSAPPRSPTRATRATSPRVVTFAARRRPARRPPGHRPQRRRRWARSRTRSCSARPACTASQIDPVARRARVEAGVLWEDVVDAAAAARPRRRCTARRPTSASSATRSAAASAGSPARTACRPTASPPLELVTADGELVARRRRARARPVLGAARRRRQLRRRHRARVRAVPDHRGLRRACMAWDWSQSERVLQRWAAWAAGRPRRGHDGARGSSSSRRCPRSRSSSAAASSSSSTARSSATRTRRPRCSRRCASSARRSTCSARVPMPALTRLHGDPEEPMPYTGDDAMLAAFPPEAVSAFVARAGPGLGLVARHGRAAPARRRARPPGARRRRAVALRRRVPGCSRCGMAFDDGGPRPLADPRRPR